MKFSTIIHLTLALVRRRLGLYTAAVALAIGLQVAIVALVPAKHADLAASGIVLPMLTALIYAFVAGDALKTSDDRAIWGRILERVWAVIVIDFINTAFAVVSLAVTSAGTLAALAGGTALQMLVALTVFADVVAVLDDDGDRWFTLVTRSYARTFGIALQRGNLWRCFVVYGLSLVALVLETGLAELVTRIGIPSVSFWGPLALGTILAVPISAFTIVVYFDATGIRIPALAADDTVQ